MVVLIVVRKDALQRTAHGHGLAVLNVASAAAKNGHCAALKTAALAT